MEFENETGSEIVEKTPKKEVKKHAKNHVISCHIIEYDKLYEDGIIFKKGCMTIPKEWSK